MKKMVLTFLMLPVTLSFGCANANQMQRVDRSVDMSVREISAKSSDDVLRMLDEARSAVVGISVEINGGYAIGSGVAISEGGYILTNNHVVEDGGEITLYYADKTTGVGSVLWADPAIDLAVVKSSRTIPYLSTEDLENTFVGEDVYAIGTPLTLDFKHTITKGIVSAKNRVLETDGNDGSIFLQSLVQHDASINPGNSGGPLINVNGKVVGLNTLKTSEGEGLGFAIPIRIGKIVAEKLKENNNYKTPYIGIFAFDSSLAEVYGEELNDDGAYVISVSGPAKDAGIKKGDLITAIDGQTINNMLDFRALIYEKNIGDDVEVLFLRDGIYQRVNVKLGKRG